MAGSLRASGPLASRAPISDFERLLMNETSAAGSHRATRKDAHEEGPVMPAAPAADQVSTRTPGGAPAGATDLDSADLTVLEAVMSQPEPMTAGRLARITALPPTRLCTILEALCELGLLRRLNTVIPSYTAGR